MCETGKRPYPSPQAASRDARAVMSRKAGPASRASWCGGKLETYKCGRCGQWHIGHAAPKPRAVKIKELLYGW